MATVIGFYGTQLDAGAGQRRWERWRPTLSLFQHPDLEIDQLELLVPRAGAADVLVSDVAAASPGTRVVERELPLRDPWDFEEVYSALHDYVRARGVVDGEDLLVHITTGTHVAQICLFLLTEARFLPARLLQTGPPRRKEARAAPGRSSTSTCRATTASPSASRREQGDGQSASLKSASTTRNRRSTALIERIERVAPLDGADLLTGPTGRGQVAARAPHLRAEAAARHQLAGALRRGQLRHPARRRRVSTLFGHKPRRVHRRRREPAGPAVARATAGCCSSTRSASSARRAGDAAAGARGAALPAGRRDKEVESDFQLIAGTNRDLASAVRAGASARTCSRASTCGRSACRVCASASRTSSPTSTTSSSVRAALRSAGRHEPGGAGALPRVRHGRLEQQWREPPPDDLVTRVLGDDAQALDRFDRVQLADVLRVCAESRSLADAGRTLFAASRQRRTSVNDGDRLRKYLARFGLDFDRVSAAR
jgi:transcriptional regulatory protein RtcR